MSQGRRTLVRTLRRRLVPLAAALALGSCDDPAAPVATDAPPSYLDTSLILRADAPAPPEGRPGHITLLNYLPDGSPLVRFDKEGNSIDAHDGEIERFGDRYYLYGVSYGCGFQLAVPGSPFCGIRAYSSPDLVEWTSHGFLFDGSTATWQQRCNGSQYGCYRPHVAYNALTNRYVLWINTYETAVGFRVFEATRPEGPFTERGTPTLAEMTSGTRNGDHNLFVDGDGTAYLAFTDWRNQGDIVVEELDRAYLSGTGRHVRLGIRSVEAPSIFKRAGRYYLVFGDPNCGYCRTGASYVTAAHPLGPWSARKRLVERCGGQPTHSAMLPGLSGDTVYLYQGDLWNDFLPNQSTAAHFWTPMEFTAAGDIRPIDCATHAYLPVPILAGGKQTASVAPAQLTCDIGNGAAGSPQYEARFTAPRAGRLRTVALPLFRRGARVAPLFLEVRSGTRLLKRIAIGSELVAWSARRVTVTPDLPLTAGSEYALRLLSASGEGCYGFAFDRFAQVQPQLNLYSSADDGRAWQPLAGRVLRAELEIAAN